MFPQQHEVGKSIPLPACHPEFATWKIENCNAEYRRIRERIIKLTSNIPDISFDDFTIHERQKANHIHNINVEYGYILEAIYLRRFAKKAKRQTVLQSVIDRHLAKISNFREKLNEIDKSWEEKASNSQDIREILALMDRKEAIDWRLLQLVWKKILIETPQYFVKIKVENRFQCLMNKVARVFNKRYNSHYTTTFYPGIYVPHSFKRWRPSRIVELFDHERIHLLQYQRVGGTVPFLFLYNLVPFPALIAYFRYKWEKEAYERTIVHLYHWKGETYLRSKYFIEEVMIPRLNGPEYGFTWFNKDAIRKWISETVDKVVNGKIQ